MSDIRLRMTSCALAAAFIFAGHAWPAGASPADPYAAGMREVQQAIANGNLDLAERTAKELSRRFANNAEVLSVRGRVLFWQKRYDESIASLRAAQKLKPSPELSAELARVQTARQLAEADRLLAEKKEAQAEKILLRLFESGSATYDAGLRLARLRVQGGAPREGSRVLGRMLRQFPRERELVFLNAQALLAAGAPDEALSFLDGRKETAKDPELLALRGRSLMRLQRFAEAAASFRSSLALADDAQVRLEAERAEVADLLERADRLTAQGDLGQATTLLRGAFEGGRDRYGTGLRLASLYTKAGEKQEAARVYLSLKNAYPNDRELALLYARSLAHMGQREQALGLLDELEKEGEYAQAASLRGRILFWQGRYRDAGAEYERAVRLGADAAGLAPERSEVQAALDYQRLKMLVEARDYQAAEPLMERMAAAEGPYRREARLLKLKLLITRKRTDEAVALGSELQASYPNDPEVSALYAESLILAGEGGKARALLEGLTGTAEASLRRDREDLFYRARRNWFKAYGSGYGYSDGYRSEKGAGVAASRRFRRFTGVAGASETSRFGETDTQLTMDLYFVKRPQDKFYGSLSLSVSPGASFLPKYSFGGEIIRPLGSFELSAAYNRLNFSGDSSVLPGFGTGADVLSAALLYYVPSTAISLGERVYFSPENGTVTSVTTVRWDPGVRLSAFASAGIGNSAESPSDKADLLRYSTFSLRGGAEYRFAPSYSVGAEASSESRSGLYDRKGASVFVKYWWP